MDILIAIFLFICVLIFVPGAWSKFYAVLLAVHSVWMIVHRFDF